MRKTARISFVVEYDDEHETPLVSFENLPDHLGNLVALNVENALLIGTPRIDHHAHPVTALSRDELIQICTSMLTFGGQFARSLSTALVHADADNTERIEEEFWNLLCKYRSMTCAPT